MQNNSRYLKWCLRQEKGIRLVTPSDNLLMAYLEKSHNALKSMEVNAQAGITEWAVSASYYAKYFAVYALFAKIGVKCEIHDCTIALFSDLFDTAQFHHLARDLRKSKENRIDAQYYSTEIKVNLDELMLRTKEFALQIEELIDGLTAQEIANLQKRLRAIASDKK
ncbi:MAG: HEPN domain-containing protein [Candidatus Bathyarchaeia archaeon]